MDDGWRDRSSLTNNCRWINLASFDLYPNLHRERLSQLRQQAVRFAHGIHFGSGSAQTKTDGSVEVNGVMMMMMMMFELFGGSVAAKTLVVIKVRESSRRSRGAEAIGSGRMTVDVSEHMTTIVGDGCTEDYAQ